MIGWYLYRQGEFCLCHKLVT